MKQRITIKQLKELNNKGKEELRKWWDPQVGDFFIAQYQDIGDNKLNDYEEYCFGNADYQDYKGEKLFRTTSCGCYSVKLDKKTIFPLLSIGQMIEFLDKKTRLNKISYVEMDKVWEIGDWGGDDLEWRLGDPKKSKELCDALWEACKKELEK